MNIRKKAIITGASRGIGRGIALTLAQEGYDIAFNYSSHDEKAQAVVEQIKTKYGVNCYAFKSHFQEKGAIELFVRQAIDALNGVDLLVNNAAYAVQGGELIDIDDSTMDLMFAVNLRSVVLISREVARYMVKNNVEGNIINISSVRAERAFPGAGLYCGIKAAINQMTSCFALDMAPYKIRVNAIEPGATRVRTIEDWRQEGFTEEEIAEKEKLPHKIPLERMGSPKDIANAVVFLASDKASYITGSVLKIDGGLILAGMPEEKGAPGSEDRGWGYVLKRTEWDW